MLVVGPDVSTLRVGSIGIRVGCGVDGRLHETGLRSAWKELEIEPSQVRSTTLDRQGVTDGDMLVDQNLVRNRLVIGLNMA